MAKSGSNYIVKGVVTLLIFGALIPTTFTSLAAINTSAVIIGVVTAVEIVFCVGVLYKIAEEAGMV